MSSLEQHHLPWNTVIKSDSTGHDHLLVASSEHCSACLCSLLLCFTYLLLLGCGQVKAAIGLG